MSVFCLCFLLRNIVSSFIVSSLTFRSLIHFEFVFVYDVRKFSSFILLHVVDQFSQHHLLKRPSFLHCIFFASFIEDKVSIGAWLSLWIYFTPFIYSSVFVPVPYCLDDCSFVLQYEIRKVDLCSSILLSLDCFGQSGSLCLNCEIICSSSVKNTFGSLIGIALTLQIALGSVLFSVY